MMGKMGKLEELVAAAIEWKKHLNLDGHDYVTRGHPTRKLIEAVEVYEYEKAVVLPLMAEMAVTVLADKTVKKLKEQITQLIRDEMKGFIGYPQQKEETVNKVRELLDALFKPTPATVPTDVEAYEKAVASNEAGVSECTCSKILATVPSGTRPQSILAAIDHFAECPKAKTAPDVPTSDYAVKTPTFIRAEISFGGVTVLALKGYNGLYIRGLELEIDGHGIKISKVLGAHPVRSGVLTADAPEFPEHPLIERRK